MKRALILFIVLTVGLSVALYLKLRAQRLEAGRPSGGSATIEGTEVDVTARLAARIVAIHAAEGDRVEAGQLLVELDCREPQALLAQAEAAAAAATVGRDAAELGVQLAAQGATTATSQRSAAEAATRASRAQQRVLAVQLAAAKRSSKRIATVHASGATSDQLLDQAETQVAGLSGQAEALHASVSAAEAQAAAAAGAATAAATQIELARAKQAAAVQELAVAAAALDRARVAVAECRIAAPAAGIVQSRNFEPGEVVVPGSRILNLVDTREVKAIFYLPNAELDAAKPGQPCEVTADAYPKVRFKGVVRRVAPSAEFTPRNVQTREDRDRLVYAVEARIPNPDGRLRPGMPVEIVLPGTARGDE